MVNITSIDLLTLATSVNYADQIASIATSAVANASIQFLSYNESFVTDILGPNVSESLISTSDGFEAFHEAGIYNIATNSLYFASNWIGNISNPVNVTVLNLTDYTVSETRYDGLNEPNGGCAWYPPSTPLNSSEGQLLLFCDEGDLVNPSQLVLVDPVTRETTVVLNSFLGRNFSSLNDIEQDHISGDLFFTDARYGYWQYFRPPPVIAPQVYRYNTTTGVVQAVADGFIAPNGIEFSPDFKHIYVTDTGSKEFGTNLTRPATIYKYDFSPDRNTLINRRVFAYSDNGFPDGIHTDTAGNVFSASGDGIHVWNTDGVLLGKIIVNGGSNNFAFIPGALIMGNANKLWKIGLKAQGRTVARDFGLM